MSLMLTLLAAALQTAADGAPVETPAVGAPQAVEDEEIIVLGKRLANWRGQANPVAKRPRCKTIRSTGDRRIDRIGCDAMVYCIVTTREAFGIRDEAQFAGPAADTAEFRRAMGACVRDQRKLGLSAYAASRRKR